MLETNVIKVVVGRFFAIALLATLCAGIAHARAASDQLRSWQISDSIAVTYYTDHDSNVYAWPAPESQDTAAPFEPRFILPSPNGHHFLFLTHKGLLDKDSNFYRLSIYQVDLIKKELSKNSELPTKAPIEIALETTSSTRGAISDVVWLPDSSGVLFLGFPNPQDAVPQLMRVEVPSGRVTQLTHTNTKIESKAYLDGGVLYQTLDADLADDSQVYPVVTLPRTPGGDLEWPSPYANFRDATLATYEGRKTFEFRPAFEKTWLLPGGKEAVALRTADSKAEYSLLNLQTGELHPLSETQAKTLREKAEKRATKSKVTEKLNGIEVAVRQSANDPPAVIVSDGRNEKVLAGPDPALAGVWIARSEPFTWKEAEGQTKTGLLLKPRAAEAGKRLPLVIQIQLHADPRVFLPDGLQSSGYAAQVFAAQGFAVLIVPYALFTEKTMDREGPAIVARLDAAVDALDSAGIIDRNKVGLVGFSRNGFQTHYAVTHPARTVFAAAAVLDSFTGDYASNLASGARAGRNRDSNPYMPMAIESFWANKPKWLEHEFTFNVDRVRTPVLFTMHGKSPLHEEYDSAAIPILGAYRVNLKPIEYLWLPKATHALIRPQERLAEMGAVVDWMGFWLQDQAPKDSERAKRWAPLRDMQAASLRAPSPPRGKWVFVSEP